jgi:hypothetical protein
VKPSLLPNWKFSFASASQLLVLSAILGCSGDPDFKPVYDVPPEYQVFVDKFIKEAANRGVTLEIENLIVKNDPNLSSPHCAQCNSNALTTDIQKVITLNPDIKCWFTDEEHEAFFFHELGHCILGRLHDNSLLPNGNFKSMMNEGDVTLYAPCLYQIGDDPCPDNTFKRTYYLDELFDENTSVPYWGN